MKRLIWLCNAMDDRVRAARGITSDSPAAARKVALACAALRTAGVTALILSLGRGPRTGAARAFGWEAARLRGVAVVYCPLVQLPLLSQLVSLLAPLAILWRFRRQSRATTLVLYNRMPSHLAAAWAARLLGYRVVLDFEDGPIAKPALTPSYLKIAAIESTIDAACNGGALVACSALAAVTRLQPQLCYYGTVEARAWSPHADRDVRVLIGGTVATDTGAPLLVEAIRRLRATRPAWAQRLSVVVTGSGDGIAPLAELAATDAGPRVTVHGRTTDADYEAILRSATVGLALKPNVGPLAHTTFPSKVVEMAAAGLLVVSTDISDVRLVLGDDALYLERDDPDLLIERLRWITEHPDETEVMRKRAMEVARARCAPREAGAQLADFLFPAAR